MRDDERKGFLWRLPTIESTDWGKLGPAFGYGMGCGFGVGAGIIGGAGLGVGFPGLQFGVGCGAGCGIGVGFGYGLGKGWAYDQNTRYSNIGRHSERRSSKGETVGDLGAMINEVAGGIRKVFDALEREAEKRRSCHDRKCQSDVKSRTRVIDCKAPTMSPVGSMSTSGHLLPLMLLVSGPRHKVDNTTGVAWLCRLQKKNSSSPLL